MNLPAADPRVTLGEGLLGTLIERAHTTPPQQIGSLVTEEVQRSGGTDVVLYVQDYDQAQLFALPPAAADAQPVDGSLAGRAFTTDSLVEQVAPAGTRLFLPLLNGTDRVGVLALTLPEVSDQDRRMVGQLAGLVAELLITKGSYTDFVFQVRRARPMSLAAEMLWHLLPPLTLSTPQVAVAGVLEPAYDVGGDVFDYAYNDATLHVAVFDAMGHGLRASLLAAATVGAYRHARRQGAALDETYLAVDDAIAGQFAGEAFATGLLAELDTHAGELRWVSAGHPAPLLVRDGRVRPLGAVPTLPAGLGGSRPAVLIERLQPGDRALLYTDGVVEERGPDGRQFGEDRLADHLQRACLDGLSLPETVRRLNHTLIRQRAGITSDDATLLALEWRGRTESAAVPVPR